LTSSVLATHDLVGVFREIMAIPTCSELMHPLLRVLAEREEALPCRDVFDRVADRVRLSAGDKELLLPSGYRKIYQHRIGWAHDRLKRKGLSSAYRRGWWQATAEGKDLALSCPRGFDRLTLSWLCANESDDPACEFDSLLEPFGAVWDVDPEERIDHAVKELDACLATELLEKIHQSTPEFFERLVLDLLVAMGYGTENALVKREGGTGDGGIDGVISLDHLGLEKICVQAKRWKDNAVGSAEIRDFYGALADRRATKGVFITTAHFTPNAKKYAERSDKNIVLMDGKMLVHLMIEHGVGVSIERVVKIQRVNEDYFE
jgi:restriction system protein